VTKNDEGVLKEIEDTQEKLRESIEESKWLANRSQQLLDCHKRQSRDRPKA